MKYFFLFLALIASSASAAQEPIKIVFDVTSSNPSIHQSTIRHVNLMASSYPNSNVEVVIYSGSIAMVLKDQSTIGNEIIKFKNNSNISFAVCAKTMKRKKVSESQLLEGVEIVPDGILEIVQKQAQGWSYIKEAD